MSLDTPMPPVNYDETKVIDYQLPDALSIEKGKTISSAAEWESIGRKHWLAIFEKELYGKLPPSPDTIEFEASSQKKVFNNRAVRYEILLRAVMNSGKFHDLHLLLYTPPGDGPFPVFCGLNFQGNYATTTEPDLPLPEHHVNNNARAGVFEHQAKESARGNAARRWPFEYITGKGYAVVTACYGEIHPDTPDGRQKSIYQLFDVEEFPAISAWSWGLSRLADFAENFPVLDKDRIAVFGHSRLGKAALWAGVNDPRFHLVISNDSGCCGAALSRRKFGETYKLMQWNEIEYWFCKQFCNYIDKEEHLPFDQHILLSLVAPRPLYVASASEDLWADPRGEFLALKESGKVYNLFGLCVPQEFPEADNVSHAYCRYHLRKGAHDILLFDWKNFIDFADGHWKSRGI